MHPVLVYPVLRSPEINLILKVIAAKSQESSPTRILGLGPEAWVRGPGIPDPKLAQWYDNIAQEWALPIHNLSLTPTSN